MTWLSALLNGGDTVKVIGDTVDKLFTSDDEKLAHQVELDKAEKAYKIRMAEIDASLVQGQLDINKIEASSAQLFVAGWRPFVGWVCGFAISYNFLVEPLLRFIAQVIFGYHGAFPVLDTEALNPILMGMLGLGALRTVEKVKGAA